jgi:3-mercaptopyruvate sulfurtransferase SseA
MSKKGLKKIVLLFTSNALMLVLLGCAAAPAAQPSADQSSPATVLPEEITRVSPQDAKAAFDNGKALFVDVRGASSYAASHIPGALSIPLVELEARINELDPNHWIITYCT